jgi:hypothetical protein
MTVFEIERAAELKMRNVESPPTQSPSTVCTNSPALFTPTMFIDEDVRDEINTVSASTVSTSSCTRAYACEVEVILILLRGALRLIQHKVD